MQNVKHRVTSSILPGLPPTIPESVSADFDNGYAHGRVDSATANYELTLGNLEPSTRYSASLSQSHTMTESQLTSPTKRSMLLPSPVSRMGIVNETAAESSGNIFPGGFVESGSPLS